MSEDVLKLALQVLGVLIGGGLLQFFISLLRRGPENRKTNSEAELNQATVSDKQVERLQSDIDRYHDQIQDLDGKLTRVEDRLTQERKDHAEALRIANDENSRLASRVAQLTTDLNIAHRQIQDLELRGNRHGL